jgi:hypothetical protein
VLSSPQLQYSETYGLALEGLAGEALIA